MTCPDYEFPDDWDEMTTEERQRFFDEFRERLYTFWRAEADYERRRAERVDEHRVEEPLT